MHVERGLASGPVGRARSRQDCLQCCLIGRKLSLQICLQKMNSVSSPEDLAVHQKAWNAEYSGRDGILRLQPKLLLDILALGLLQERFPVEPHAVGHIVSDGIQAGNEHPADARRLDRVIPKPGLRVAGVCR